MQLFLFCNQQIVTVIIDKCERAELVTKDGKLFENTEECLFRGSVKGQSV